MTAGTVDAEDSTPLRLNDRYVAFRSVPRGWLAFAAIACVSCAGDATLAGAPERGRASVTSPAPPPVAVQAVAADAFVDSVGVNVHLGFLDTPYHNFAEVQQALLDLGVRHIRDGMVEGGWPGYFTEHNSLGAHGIKTVFITDVGQTAATFQSYPQRMNQCFEAYEDPNEYDNRGNSHWVEDLTAQMTLLADTVRRQPNRFPIYGPSLVHAESFPKLGDVHTLFDDGNLHNYLSGRHPGTSGWGGPDAEGHAYGSMPWQFDLARIDAPSLPIVSTETGYTNQMSLQGQGIPEDVSAVYLPRLLLEQWNAGIKSTYLYELISVMHEDYGLFRPDWTAKPGFYAVANLLKVLSDPGPPFRPGSLTFSLQGGDANLHHLLLQKRDGSFYLALWVERSRWDVDAKHATPVSPETVRLQLAHPAKMDQLQWNESGQVKTSSLNPSQPLTLQVGDELTILQIAK